MGRITVTLTDEIEKKLRSYVSLKYPERPFGKLNKVVEISVKEYLEKHENEHIGSTQTFY